MTNKEQYRQLCEAEGSRIPLFQQYWWMETVCAGKEWDVILCRQGDAIVGALPYLIGSKLGLRFALAPQLTQFGGPWTAPELDFDSQMKVLDDLAGQLDEMHLALYLQTFGPTQSNWLPFYWRHYRQSTRYTYRFDPLLPLSEHMAQAQPQRRKRMELLEQECTLDKAIGVDEFVAFHNEYYTRRDGHNIVPPALVERVCRTALERRQGLIYGLRDHQGRLLVADMVVYDSRCAYSLLSGIADGAPRNATTLLFWKIIEALKEVTEAFDFEGSMDSGIEQFYRSFGATQTPLLRVWRSRIPLLGWYLTRR